MGIPIVKDPILKEYDLKNLEKIYIDTLKTINLLRRQQIQMFKI